MSYHYIDLEQVIRGILKQEVEKVRMDLVALQEIKWLGNGTLEKKNCVISL